MKEKSLLPESSVEISDIPPCATTFPWARTMPASATLSITPMRWELIIKAVVSL